LIQRDVSKPDTSIGSREERMTQVVRGRLNFSRWERHRYNWNQFV